MKGRSSSSGGVWKHWLTDARKYVLVTVRIDGFKAVPPPRFVAERGRTVELTVELRHAK